MSEHRRSFLRNLGALSIGATAGCSTITGGKFEYVGEDAWSGYTYQAVGRQFKASGNFKLAPGEYTAKGYSAALNTSLTYNFTIDSGNGVDFFALRAREWESFKEQDDPRITHHREIEKGTTMASTTVNVGEFILVLDNTNYGPKGSGDNTSSGSVVFTGEPL